MRMQLPGRPCCWSRQGARARRGDFQCGAAIHLQALGVGKPLVASARPEMVDAAIAQAQSDAALGRAAQAFARAAEPAPDPARLLEAVLADA